MDFAGGQTVEIKPVMDAPILRFDRYSRPPRQTLSVDAAVWVEITRGRVRERLRAVRGPAFLIGTAHDCDLVLGDQTFADAYAYILVQNDKVTIRRVGSGPELQVNGDAIDVTELYHGDELTCGPFEFRMVIRERPQRLAVEAAPIAVSSWLWDGDMAEL